MHISILNILDYFKSDHLPADLKIVSQEYAKLARFTAALAPDCAETTVAVRKLLEAKDAAVRAALSIRPKTEVQP